MDQSTSLMLEAIDKRIAKLQQIREMIVGEFGQQLNGAKAPEKSRRRRKRATNREENPVSGRKLEIYEWLQANGPATRSEIIAGSGLPQGTVSGYLSAEKGLFENSDGRWSARR